MLPLFRHDDPDVRALVPRPAAIIAKHGVDAKSGAFEVAGHLPDGEGAERQVEAVLARRAAPPLHVGLLERGQMPRRILPDRFDERELGTSGVAA